MKTILNLNSFDADMIPKTHQMLEFIGLEVGKAIVEKLRQVGVFQDDLNSLGGHMTIDVNIFAPFMNKEDAALYHEAYDVCFEVLDADRIAIEINPKGNWNPDNITKTERSYLLEMIDDESNKVMAENHGKNIETVKSHTKSIRFKSKCHSPKAMKKYVDKHKLLI
jgi:DNA-binding CsgD family transcriptional regulator